MTKKVHMLRNTRVEIVKEQQIVSKLTRVSNPTILKKNVDPDPILWKMLTRGLNVLAGFNPFFFIFFSYILGL